MPTPEFLQAQHPIYLQRFEEWTRAELRFRGGIDVIDEELAPFDWETDENAVLEGVRDIQTRAVVGRPGTVLLGRPGTHLNARRRQAVYLNFMDDVATILVGHVLQKAPVPEKSGGLSFGTLGEIRRTTNRATPTRAEQLYYNTNGIGNDGSQWDSFWARVAKHALNTGHRWMMAESPSTPGRSREDELAGKRPYLLHYSPLQVPNWHYENGQLQFARIILPIRRPRIEDGHYTGNEPVFGNRLLVRKGFAAFGPAFAGGGWWDYDENGNPIPGRQGDWAATLGEIPFWPHFFERDEDRFSKATLTELGNVAVAYMNLDSAATFDAWDAAMSLQFLIGVSPEQYQEVVSKIQAGSKIVPIPPSLDQKNPVIYDGSSGAVVADVFDRRLRSLRDAVRELAGTAAVGGPDASGEAKRVGFSDRKSPRLAMMASELEVSQNTAIRFLEQRWMGTTNPTGSVVWPRDFELAPLMDQIGQLFDLEKVTGLQSDTADIVALMTAIRQLGLIADDETLNKVAAEYVEAGKARTEIQAAVLSGNATGQAGVASAKAANDAQAELARLGVGRPATPAP